MKVLIFALLLVACGPSSYEDFRELGKQKTHKLIEELQKIQNRDQLLDAQETLSQCYKEIADLIKSAEKFQKQHPNLPPLPLSEQDRELSDQLRIEMIRICRFDGGKEILENIKQETNLN